MSLQTAAGMIDTRSNTEQIADHYARYVDELREFLKCSGVPFGAPQHLAGLTRRLGEDHVFRDEMYSMTRSIIFREGGALPPTELLRLLAAAAGGATVDEQAEQHRPEIKYLLHFLTSVTRAPVNQPRGEASRPVPAAQSGRGADPITFSPSAHRAAAPWSGRPSSQALKWHELWNRFALAGTKRLFASGRRRWWLAGAAAALALLPLLLWLTHAKVPAAALHTGPAPMAAATSPQVAPEPEPLSPPLEERDTSLAPTAAAVVKLSSRSKPAVNPRRHPDRSSAPRRQWTAAHISKPRALPRPKLRRAVHPVPPFRRVPARQAATQARMEARPSAPAYPASESLAAKRSVPGLRRSEQSPENALPASPNRRGMLDVSSGVMSANLISAPAPEYPKLARAIHLQGAVILQAVIGKNGQVTATSVVQGHHLLREAAVHAVRRWRYRPFLADGRPVDVATVVTVDFRRHR